MSHNGDRVTHPKQHKSSRQNKLIALTSPHYVTPFNVFNYFNIPRANASRKFAFLYENNQNVCIFVQN